MQNDKAKVEQISKCKMQNDKAKFKNEPQRRVYRFALDVIELVVRGFGLVLRQYQIKSNIKN